MSAPSSDLQNRTRKYAQFDGLRAVAVLCVLYQHFVYMTNLRIDVDHWQYLPFKIHIGDFGIHIFFVLSGFLITDIIRSNVSAAGVDLRKFLASFYARRTLRIWPIYFLTLALAALYFPGVRETFLRHAFFLTNVLAFLTQ